MILNLLIVVKVVNMDVELNKAGVVDLLSEEIVTASETLSLGSPESQQNACNLLNVCNKLRSGANRTRWSFF